MSVGLLDRTEVAILAPPRLLVDWPTPCPLGWSVKHFGASGVAATDYPSVLDRRTGRRLPAPPDPPRRPRPRRRRPRLAFPQ